MQFKEERAKWRVLAQHGFFGPDDVLYEEDSEVFYDGEPNEELEPLNQIAHEKLVQYLEKLDQLGKEAAEKAGRPWVGRPRNIDGALAIATAVQKAEMVAMGAKKDVHTIEAVEKEEIPQMNAKKKPGRPRLNIA